MSGVLNMIKDAVTGGGNKEDTTTTSSSTTHNTTGTYNTTTGTTTGGVHNTGNAPNTQGPWNTDAANRVDPRVDSDRDGRAGYEVGSGLSSTTGNTGSMGSGVAHPSTGVGKNTTSTPLFGSKSDDPDRNHLGHSEDQELANYQAKHGHTAGISALENRADRESGHHHDGGSGSGAIGGSGHGILNPTGGMGAEATRSGLNTSSGTTSTGVGYGRNTTSGSGNTSTASGRLLDKLNPGTDNDGSRSYGSNTTTSTGLGSSTTSSGITGSRGTTTGVSGSGSEAGYPHTHAGLHAADVLTELKPGTTTHESDVHHRHNLYLSDKFEDYQTGSGVHTTGEALHGYNDGRTTTTGGVTGGNAGYGNTTGTTGAGQPVHASKVANVLDPRVDSDGDGSKLR